MLLLKGKIMRKQNGGFLGEALSVRSLFAPFRLAVTVLFIVLVLFAFSLVTQSWFHQPDLLSQELAYTQIVFERTEEKDATFHIMVIRYCYDALYWLFFKLTGLSTLFENDSINGAQELLVDAFYPYSDKLEVLNQTLKIISIRLGNLFAYLPLLICLASAALFDGLMQRKIRQKNASRESAGIYHRAKYWRTGLVSLVILIYLCLPIAIPHYLLLVPIGLLASLVFIQAKFLKKYL
jgi:integrating conjugative element membrane protein (TIGR03747 family)